MSVVIAPWLKGPDVLGAIESGARLGLSRQQMLQEAAQRGAELNLAASRLQQEGGQENANRAEREQQNAAANALNIAALKQSGLLGEQKNANAAALLEQRGGALDAREALDQARAEALERQKPVFSNTGGGLMQFDQSTGKWTLVPGSSKPAAVAKPDMETVSTKTAAVPETPAVPADVTSHFIRNLWPFGAHIPDTTNSPAIAAIPAQPERTITTKVPMGTGNSLLNVPAQTPAAPAAAPRTFTDKSGQKFIYSGTMDDPTQDTNAASWQIAPDAAPSEADTQ